MKGRRTSPGEFYWRAPSGELVPAAPSVPDVIICRRLGDFPGATMPAGGTRAICEACGAVVVTNAAKFPDRPRRCMQCSQIEPLPFES
jgi:hypothetical protein